jgi:hypothetical protein
MMCDVRNRPGWGWKSRHRFFFPLAGLLEWKPGAPRLSYGVQRCRDFAAGYRTGAVLGSPRQDRRVKVMLGRPILSGSVVCVWGACPAPVARRSPRSPGAPPSGSRDPEANQAPRADRVE